MKSTLTHNTLIFFFFNDTATTEIYTLSLHDALPISHGHFLLIGQAAARPDIFLERTKQADTRAAHGSKLLGKACERPLDRKSTRLNSSHGYISYAVFCLKKKKNN